MKPRLKSPQGSLLGKRAISSHLLQLGYPQESISSMLRCGNDTGLSIFAQCGCGTQQIKIKHHCNLRTCKKCSKRRQRRIGRKYYPFLSNLPQNRIYKLRFLTISPKNYKNLEYGLEHIKKSFLKFLRRKYIKDRIYGGFYVLETKGKEGNWNIHLHAIIYSKYLDNRIRGQCLDCGQNLIKFDYFNKKYYCANRKCNSLNLISRENSRLVNEFTASSGRACTINIQRQTTARYTLNYMAKYISSNKDEFETSKDIAKYIIATRKKRLINSFGLFYNHKFKTKKYCCPKCNEDISFIFDFEVMNFYDDPENKPPDLTSFFH